ncbi:hypothetical protein C8Q76DRAFT_699197 [Earliella scabrosa]|nr:hypothetical protein C8Q76DRAFT_699197 [Earliella scabrosa]
MAVLSSVRSSALRSISIRVVLHRMKDDGSGQVSYGVDRAGLLDLLLGGRVQNILSRFPTLRQLHFTFEDNDGEYDSRWWTAEMVRRLPDTCHATVSVNVILRLTGPWSHMWLTPEQVGVAQDAAAAERNRWPGALRTFSARDFHWQLATSPVHKSHSTVSPRLSVSTSTKTSEPCLAPYA